MWCNPARGAFFYQKKCDKHDFVCLLKLCFKLPNIIFRVYVYEKKGNSKRIFQKVAGIEFENMVFLICSIKGIPSTPQHTDFHPCTLAVAPQNLFRSIGIHPQALISNFKPIINHKNPQNTINIAKKTKQIA